MNIILGIAQIVVSCLLIVGILLQQRGSAMGSVFGGGGGGGFYGTRRGIQRKVYLSTVVLGILFILLALLNLIL